VTDLFTPQTDEILRKKALGFIVNNPYKAIQLALKKFINMWQPYYSDSRRASKIVMVFSYLPIVALGLTGMLFTIRKSRISALFILIICFYALLHMFTISGIRYRYPLIPLFMIYCAFALSVIYEKLSSKYVYK